MFWTLPQSFYDNLDPSYREVFHTFENNMIKMGNDKFKRKKVLSAFSDNYMMPAFVWKLYVDIESKKEVIEKASFGFFHDSKTSTIIFGSEVEPKVPLFMESEIVDKHKIKELEDFLRFPNLFLEHYYLLYEKYSSSPFDKEIFKEYVAKMKQLYRLIKGASKNDDIEKWFNWITKAESEKFIQINIEQRLSNDLTNKKLWNLYIKYLEKENKNEMLHVFSKYCRFFIDDFEMKRKYSHFLKLYGSIYIKWKNMFDFEEYYMKKFYYNLTESFKSLSIKQKRWNKNFKVFSNDQSLAFKSSFVRYILFNANVTVLSKLHQTCKYFFQRRPIFPCYRFVLKHLEDIQQSSLGKFKYVENSMEYSSNFIPKNEDGKNLYVGTSLYANHISENMLSNFIKEKFFKCDAIHIEIKKQKLTENEFKFLVGHGNVESCHLELVKISMENDKQMLVEEILTKMPKLQHFGYCNSNFAVNALDNLSFINKILHWSLKGINENFDPESFCNFIKKNAAPFSFFEIMFKAGTSNENLTTFRSDVDRFLFWDLPQPKPKLKIYKSILPLIHLNQLVP